MTGNCAACCSTRSARSPTTASHRARARSIAIGADTDADVVAACITVSARHGDADLFDEYFATASATAADAAGTAPLPVRARGSSPTEELVLRAARWRSTDAVRTQNAPFVAPTRAARTASTARWCGSSSATTGTTIEARFPRTLIAAHARRRHLARRRRVGRDVPQFVAAHPIPEGERVIAQHLERQRVHRALRRARARTASPPPDGCARPDRLMRSSANLTFAVRGGRYRWGRWRWSASPSPSGPGSRRASPRPRPRRTQGWPAIAGGRPHADPRPDRLGQDARRVPLGDRPARDDPEPAKAERCRVLYISPLRALAVDVEKNLRAPLAGHRASRPNGSACRCASPTVGDAHRRHARQGTPGARAHAARHPHHHARVALPDAHVASARDVAVGRVRDHRRDPRAGADQARRAPHAEPRAARRDRATDRRSASASRRRSARSTRSRASSAATTRRRAAPGHDRRRRLAQGARPRGHRPGRRHGRARRRTRRTGRRRRRARSTSTSRTAREHLAARAPAARSS